jgi:hypothetical protein
MKPQHSTFQRLETRFSGFSAAFYEFSSSRAGKLFSFLGLTRFSNWVTKRFKKPVALVSLELFVAVSLALYYFFLMLYGASGKYVEWDNTFSNTQAFTYLSHHPVSASRDWMDSFPDWKTRLAAPMLSGFLTDRAWDFCAGRNFEPESCCFGIGAWRYSVFRCTFAFYHAAWLFALFCLLSFYRTDALLIILGTFAGLMLSISNVGGYKAYSPFDMPMMFFFTWAIITYDNSKRVLPLATVICLGALFRETVMVSSLLILFGEHWPWRKRIIGFVSTFAVYLAAKKLLVLAYAVPIATFSWDNFHSGIHLFDNFQLTFISHRLNSPLIVNAGSLLIMLLLPWRTYRDKLFKLVTAAFVAPIFVFAASTEVRVWLDVLPLGWMMISEFISGGFVRVREGDSIILRTSSGAAASNASKGANWLLTGTFLTTILVCFVVGMQWPMSDIVESKKDRDIKPAFIAVANNFAWALATSPKPENRSGDLAVVLAEYACKQANYQTVFIGTLAAAYAEAGRFEDAISTAQRACTNASELKEMELLQRNKELLRLYQKHQAYHEEPPRPSDSFYE